MTLANPGTGEPFSTAVVNGDFLILESAITVLQSQALIAVADLTALITLAAGSYPGRSVYVTAMKTDFKSVGGTWTQQGVATFPDTATRDTEYAKASGAFKVQGARCRITGSVYPLYYSVAAAGWKGGELGAAEWLVKPPITGSGAGNAVASLADGSFTFSACTAFVLNPCFTDDFLDYQLDLFYQSSVAGAVVNLNPAVAGTPDTTASYTYGGRLNNVAAAGADMNGGGGVTTLPIGNGDTGAQILSRSTVRIFGPKPAARGTVFECVAHGSNSGATPINFGWQGRYVTAKAFDSLQISVAAGATITGFGRLTGRNNG